MAQKQENPVIIPDSSISLKNSTTYPCMPTNVK